MRLQEKNSRRLPTSRAARYLFKSLASNMMLYAAGLTGPAKGLSQAKVKFDNARLAQAAPCVVGRAHLRSSVNTDLPDLRTGTSETIGDYSAQKVNFVCACPHSFCPWSYLARVGGSARPA